MIESTPPGPTMSSIVYRGFIRFLGTRRRLLQNATNAGSDGVKRRRFSGVRLFSEVV